MPLQQDELQTLAVKYVGKLMLDPQTRAAADRLPDHHGPGGPNQHHQEVANLINNDPDLRPSTPMTAGDADDLHTYIHENMSWFLEPLHRMGAIECADGVTTQHCPRGL